MELMILIILLTIILLHVLQNKSFRSDRVFLREGSPLHEGGTSQSADTCYRILPDQFSVGCSFILSCQKSVPSVPALQVR